MNMYQIEQLAVEQQNLLADLNDYVETKGVDQELHIAEQEIFSHLLKLGRVFLQQVIAKHGDGSDDRLILNDKGQEILRHGKKTRQYISIFGALTIERAYYWSPGGEGYCPLDANLNLPRHSHSYLLQQWMQSAVVETPYAQAVQGLAELLHQDFHTSTQQLITRTASQHFSDYYKQKVLKEPEGEVLVATADCKGVAMVPSERPFTSKDEELLIRRGKGEKKKGLRKSAVVTSDYSFNPISRRADEVIEGLMHVNATTPMKSRSDYKHRSSQSKDRQPINKHVSANMSGKVEAFSGLCDRLAQRDPTESRPIFVLLDGEHALKCRIEDEFAKRGWDHRVEGYCLDIIHAVEYLWDAGSALWGEKSSKRPAWVRRQLLSLLDGQVGRIIGGLKQTLTKNASTLKRSQVQALRKVVQYFENHKNMMRYDVYLKKGFPIATGIIEGACSSLVKDRTDRSGMKWTKAGAQAVLNFRALKHNGDWKDYWRYYIALEGRNLYGMEEPIAA